MLQTYYIIVCFTLYKIIGGAKKMKKMFSKLGQTFGLASLLTVVIIFVIAGLLAVFSLDILEDTQDDMTTNGAAYNASNDAIDGVAKIPDKMPTLGNVVIAAIIIGVLLSAFGGFLAVRQFQ